ncbi:AAA family ATPase [Tunturiibacter gelidiferens]|uniref:AAA family ATPase n=1 Tax=Tunturiibacter gelidiferens TaxID=3069689 RepID=UPI003D9B7126
MPAPLATPADNFPDQPTCEITRAVRHLLEPDDPFVDAVYQICAKKRNGKGIGSGTYSNTFELVKKARNLSQNTDVEAVWVRIHELSQDFPTADFQWNGKMAADTDVTAWRWIFIDVDTDASEGKIPSAEDKQLSRQDAINVRKMLDQHGIPVTTADSGNGWHLLIPFRQPVSPETSELVRKFVQAVAYHAEAQLKQSHIDTKVTNPSRLCKLYGTWSRKADSEELWRCSKLLTESYTIATTQQIQAFIDKYPIPEPKPSPARTAEFGGEITEAKMEEFFDFFGIRHNNRKPFKGSGSKWYIKDCPIGHHTTPSTSSRTMVSLSEGIPGFCCHAEKCGAYGWKQLREHLESGGRKFSFFPKSQPERPENGQSEPADDDWVDSVAEDTPDAPLTFKESKRGAKPKLITRPMSDIKTKPVKWLWQGYLPEKLTILAGAPGTGKSTMAYTFAGIVSSGGYWPDGTKAKQGRVLIWSGEDTADDIIKPRLVEAGADPNFIEILEHAPGPDGAPVPFDPAIHIPDLRELVEYHGDVLMIIIDPIVSAVTGDMNKSNEVRRALDGIGDLADDFHANIFGITHFGKNTQGKDATERLLGSQAFGAKPRMVLVTGKDRVTEECVIVRSKSNIAPCSGGFKYKLNIVQQQSETNEGELDTVQIEWLGHLEGNARDILFEIENGPTEPTAFDKAKQLLRSCFDDKPEWDPKEVFELGKLEGIGQGSIRQAYKVIGADTKKAFGGGAFWFMPEGQS